MQGRRLAEAQRQLLVAALAAAEQQHVPGTVHRLHRPRLAVDIELEHEILELREVPGGEEGLRVVDDRRLDLEIAALRVFAAPDVLELLPDHHPLRMPERRSRRALREVEEVEFRPEPPVIAAL